MLLKSITGLSPDDFRDKVRESKLLLLYPWTTYRNVFLAYIVDDVDKDLIYYRVADTDLSVHKWLTNMQAHLSSQVEGMGAALAQSLNEDDPVRWAEAFATDLQAFSEKHDKPIWMFIDEVDRIPHSEELRQFITTLVKGVGPNIQFIVSSRLLRYQPWYNLIADGDAVVLGTERRANDVMFTVVDEPKPALEVYALGRGYALVNGEEITNWDGALPRNLFFYFVDNPLVTRDQIFEVFWPNLSTKDATNVFHVTKRKISERITMKVDAPGNYELTQYGSGFYTPSEKVIRYYDTHEFEDAVNRAMTTVDEGEEAELLKRAIDLYKGPFLQDGTMGWIHQRRDELRQLYAQALIGMGRLRNREEDEMSALGYFIRALKETPEREDIHREVMTIYLNQGMMDDAESQYLLLEKTLDDSLGIGPSRESRELYDMVLSRK